MLYIWLPDENKHENGDHVFCHGKGNKDHTFKTGSLVNKCLETIVKKVEFVNDRVSY
jgi:hypothetical protein